MSTPLSPEIIKNNITINKITGTLAGTSLLMIGNATVANTSVYVQNTNIASVSTSGGTVTVNLTKSIGDIIVFAVSVGGGNLVLAPGGTFSVPAAKTISTKTMSINSDSFTITTNSSSIYTVIFVKD